MFSSEIVVDEPEVDYKLDVEAVLAGLGTSVFLEAGGSELDGIGSSVFLLAGGSAQAGSSISASVSCPPKIQFQLLLDLLEEDWLGPVLKKFSLSILRWSLT